MAIPFITSKTTVYTEKIDFRTFLKGNAPQPVISPRNRLKSTSFSISPLLFIDPVFLGIGMGILGIALAEKALATKDHLPAAALLASIIEITFPLAGFAAAIYFISRIMFIM